MKIKKGRNIDEKGKIKIKIKQKQTKKIRKKGEIKMAGRK